MQYECKVCNAKICRTSNLKLPHSLILGTQKKKVIPPIYHLKKDFPVKFDSAKLINDPIINMY